MDGLKMIADTVNKERTALSQKLQKAQGQGTQVANKAKGIKEKATKNAAANAAAAAKKKDEEDAFNKYDKDKYGKQSPAEVKAFAKEALEFDTPLKQASTRSFVRLLIHTAW